MNDDPPNTAHGWPVKDGWVILPKRGRLALEAVPADPKKMRAIVELAITAGIADFMANLIPVGEENG